jgi:L-glutamine-phosphate cytidylyltransferase
MDALILAAGRGTRMGNIEKPKCLLDIGGTTMIEYQIKCFKNIGINQIFIVTGYNSEMIEEYLTEDVTYIKNSEYASTNNLYSIWVANKIINDDFICVYGDLFFDQQILQNCINDDSEICMVLEKKIRNETMKARLNGEYIVEVNKKISENLASGNFIGMAKFKKQIIPLFFDEISKLVNQGNYDSYYTDAIESMIKTGSKINYVTTNNLSWLDMDEKFEFEEAKKIYQKIIESDQ